MQFLTWIFAHFSAINAKKVAIRVPEKPTETLTEGTLYFVNWSSIFQLRMKAYRKISLTLLSIVQAKSSNFTQS